MIARAWPKPRWLLLMTLRAAEPVATARWTALVPLKGGDKRKSRLAGRLSLEQRRTLSDAMADHVLNCLSLIPAIDRIVILSPRTRVRFAWRRDEGRGLNGELQAFRADDPVTPLLVIHGDLPLLDGREVTALLATAERTGRSLAPDRHGCGTNALALFEPGPFPFAFGEESMRLHIEAPGSIAIVVRQGLAMDVDSPDDLDAVGRIEPRLALL